MIVFLILVSACSLLACRMWLIFVCWSCILWPCWTHLLVLGCPFFFLKIPWDFLCKQSIMSSTNMGSFISYFLTYYPFISFSCLIALIRTFRTIFNKSGKVGILALFLTLEQSINFFSLLYLMLSVAAESLYQVEEVPL